MAAVPSYDRRLKYGREAELEFLNLLEIFCRLQSSTFFIAIARWISDLTAGHTHYSIVTTLHAPGQSVMASQSVQINPPQSTFSSLAPSNIAASFSGPGWTTSILVLVVSLLVLEQSIYRYKKAHLPGAKWTIPIIGKFAGKQAIASGAV